VARRRERYRQKQDAGALAKWEEHQAYRKAHPLAWGLLDIFGTED
jgi:hypothetical protein